MFRHSSWLVFNFRCWVRLLRWFLFWWVFMEATRKNSAGQAQVSIAISTMWHHAFLSWFLQCTAQNCLLEFRTPCFIATLNDILKAIRGSNAIITNPRSFHKGWLWIDVTGGDVVLRVIPCLAASQLICECQLCIWVFFGPAPRIFKTSCGRWIAAIQKPFSTLAFMPHTTDTNWSYLHVLYP